MLKAEGAPLKGEKRKRDFECAEWVRDLDGKGGTDRTASTNGTSPPHSSSSCAAIASENLLHYELGVIQLIIPPKASRSISPPTKKSNTLSADDQSSGPPESIYNDETQAIIRHAVSGTPPAWVRGSTGSVSPKRAQNALRPLLPQPHEGSGDHLVLYARDIQGHKRCEADICHPSAPMTKSHLVHIAVVVTELEKRSFTVLSGDAALLQGDARK
ncbi:hypothetical protein PAXINDRAFT_19469 [Paxillus involutus ATCC 200175]|uniref:Uncharacterized protein n=1 Tax=Paxillus involutus ATCC 200175 TaxID=664439 RepID=A0A0C9SWS7_PAXIN|nr:hypothetical protein PAXINDRAFT_19469 [Paxillus involutus ATCC 200175]